jgi:hypothetical protein
MTLGPTMKEARGAEDRGMNANTDELSQKEAAMRTFMLEMRRAREGSSPSL